MKDFFFKGNETVLYVNCGGSYVALCVCHDSEKCQKSVNFIYVNNEKESAKTYLIKNCEQIQANIYWTPNMSRAQTGAIRKTKPHKKLPLSVGTNPLEDTNWCISNCRGAAGDMCPTKAQRRCKWRTLDSYKNCKLGEL